METRTYTKWKIGHMAILALYARNLDIYKIENRQYSNSRVHATHIANLHVSVASARESRLYIRKKQGHIHNRN